MKKPFTDKDGRPVPLFRIYSFLTGVAASRKAGLRKRFALKLAADNSNLRINVARDIYDHREDWFRK